MIGQITKINLPLSSFHGFTNHSRQEIKEWLENSNIRHYAYVWPKHLNTNVVSVEMTIIEINPFLFNANDYGDIRPKCVMTNDMMSKLKDFYQSCITMLNNPTYLTGDIHDINNLFIRPIFASDLRKIGYEVDNWYAAQQKKYEEFNNIIDRLS